jgi:hypothetical protein
MTQSYLEEGKRPRLPVGSWVVEVDRLSLDCLVANVEICYTYLNRIVPKCVHILADS